LRLFPNRKCVSAMRKARVFPNVWICASQARRTESARNEHVERSRLEPRSQAARKGQLWPLPSHRPRISGTRMRLVLRRALSLRGRPRTSQSTIARFALRPGAGLPCKHRFLDFPELRAVQARDVVPVVCQQLDDIARSSLAVRAVDAIPRVPKPRHNVRPFVQRGIHP